jgi:EPS-associated MarR family transcriptional regulator
MPKDFETMAKMLKIMEGDMEKSQRDIAAELGVSIGKVNYVIKELTVKGFVKTKRFINSRNKQAYMYILTPEGINQKLKITKDFIGRKLKEYEELMK